MEKDYEENGGTPNHRGCNIADYYELQTEKVIKSRTSL